MEQKKYLERDWLTFSKADERGQGRVKKLQEFQGGKIQRKVLSRGLR